MFVDDVTAEVREMFLDAQYITIDFVRSCRENAILSKRAYMQEFRTFDPNYDREYRLNNKSKIRAYKADYRARIRSDPDKMKAYTAKDREYGARYRAKKRMAA